jgi:FtsP/CotA-like multicopper oxidase with cupredoxin domain
MNNRLHRRGVLQTAMLLGTAALAADKRVYAQGHQQSHEDHTQHEEPLRAQPIKPSLSTVSRPLHPDTVHRVITPNGQSLSSQMIDGVRVFHLIAEEIEHTFCEGLVAHCWGYNGTTTGPTIEAYEGEKIRIYVTNRLPTKTSVHWHGLFLPMGMDGVAGLQQAPILPGETWRYEFELKQHGTFMYHPHYDEMTQMAMGMMGMFIVHPRHLKNQKHAVERDYALMLSTWKILPGTRRPDPMAMNDFNILTLNSKVFPATDALVAAVGDNVRIRIANLSPMDHHPIHMHGHAYWVTATDGGDIPLSARWPETTVLVPTGSTRTVEFKAQHPGDWPIHCHMTHHAMNQMGHGGVNMLGVDIQGIDEQIAKKLPGNMLMGNTGMGEMGRMKMRHPENTIPMKGLEGPYGYIDMGGMFTVIKVRKEVTASTSSSWYENPYSERAMQASKADLLRDGILL